jgi:hypothetical protein
MGIATVRLTSTNDIVRDLPGDRRDRCAADSGRVAPWTSGSALPEASATVTITAVRVPVGHGAVRVPGHDRYARQLTVRLHRALVACGRPQVLSTGSIYLEGALGVPEALLRSRELALVAAILAADPDASIEPRSLGQIILSGRLRGSGALVAGRLSVRAASRCASRPSPS